MTDTQSLITDIAGLSQPLTKLIETVAKGAGILYEPIHKKRMAKATAEEIKTVAEACQQNLHLPIQYNKNGIKINTDKNILELAQRAMFRNLAQEMNKQQNIENILEYTKKSLEQEKEVSNEPVSQTWLSNFFEAAGHIEEEDLQKIWGQLLAGEIKQPNSYTLRTLNVLKNMTTQEAKTFQSLISFMIVIANTVIIPNNEELRKKYHIDYGKILLLDECGLINSQPTLNLTFSSGPNSRIYMANGNLLAELYENAGINMHLKIDIHPLTATGMQLFKIIDKSSNKDFFKDYIQLIEQNNKNISARILGNN